MPHCRSCHTRRFPRRTRPQTMRSDDVLSLDQFPDGSLVRIVRAGDCPRSRGRLCAMGLTPGVLAAVRRSCHGGCLITVRDADLLIGCGLSRAILASAVPDTEHISPGTDNTCACPSEVL